MSCAVRPAIQPPGPLEVAEPSPGVDRVEARLGTGPLDAGVETGSASPPALSLQDRRRQRRRTKQDTLAASVVSAREALAVAQAAAAAHPNRSTTRAVQEAREAFHAAAWTLALTEERLAWAMAKKVRGLGDADLEDLAQFGLEGLFVAARRYDPSRGVYFSTMARWWVRATMTREAHRDRLVRLPQTMMDLSMRARGMPPGLSEHEEAVWLGASLRRLREWRAWWHDPFLALDEQAGDTPGSETIGGRLISDEPAPEDAWIEEWANIERILQTGTALLELSPRHAEVVRRYLGLDGSEPESFSALGREWSLSRERVRQLWDEAIAILQSETSARLRRRP